MVPLYTYFFIFSGNSIGKQFTRFAVMLDGIEYWSLTFVKLLIYITHNNVHL